MDIKEVAKEIRSILKKEFPATKFSVTINRFSMGESVDATWTDGPTRPQVDELISKYGDTRYRFIKTSRKHSRELVTQAIAAWKKQNPEYAHLTVTCKGETSCHTEFNLDEFYCGRQWRQDCERSLNEFIYNSAFDGTNLILSQKNVDDCEPETVSVPEPELVEVVAGTALQPQPNQLETTEQPVAVEESAVDYAVAVYHSYSCPERKNDEPKYFSLDKWRETVGQEAQLTAEAYGCLTSWNSALERMTITAICCNLPKVTKQSLKTSPQPQPNQLGQTELDALEADRQQVYAQYLASQQEADVLETKLAVKKTEAQLYFAIMKEIEEKIEAKKHEEKVISPQAQLDFDVRTLEGKKVTLILINTMGFPVSRHITVIAADIVSAKRYYGEMTDKKCLELQYVEKGKRKPKGTRYTEASLAVALDWQDIKVPANNGYIDAFDDGLFDAMVRQAKDVVYIQQGL